jgi:hypothetical protein
MKVSVEQDFLVFMAKRYYLNSRKQVLAGREDLVVITKEDEQWRGWKGEDPNGGDVEVRTPMEGTWR